MRKTILPLLLLFFFSCTNKNTSTQSGNQVQAYVPVYVLPSDLNNIGVESARSTVNAGKIYAFGNYIFQVEQYEGIHIIDNSIPSSAKKIAFLRVPLSSEISIKGNYLYTNNYKDLLVFDISNISSPKLINRVASIFPSINQNYPPYSNCYFQCVDSSKGVIVRWELKTIDQPNCKR